MAIGSISIAATVLGGLIWLWIAAVRPPRVKEPSCAKCGYPVRGLSGMTCPECGADFRLHGIATPAMRLMRSAFFIALWTLLLPIPAAVMTAWAREVGPKVQLGTCVFTLQPISGSTPAVRLTQTMRRSGWGVPGGQSGISISTRVTSSGQVTTITPNRLISGVDRAEYLLEELSGGNPTGRLHNVRLDGSGAPGVDIDALERWMRSLSGSTDRSGVRDDAAELARLIESFAASGAPVTLTRLDLVGGVATTSNRHAARWFVAALAAFWIAVYAGGIVVFMIVRRKRMAASNQGVASAKS
jgi:hypothetical protein